MKERCQECKNMVDVPKGFEIQTCLIYDHWFEPIGEDIEIENRYQISDSWNEDKIIKINSNPLLKMSYYTKAAKGEVSGFGKVRTEKDAYIITDIKIFRQRCTGEHTELNQEALAKFMLELSRRDEDPSLWNLWWHSHASMGVFFSGTDEGTIRELSRHTTLLSICVNKDGEMLGRIDNNKVTIPAKVVCVPRKVGKLWTRCNKEIKRKVTDLTWKGVNENE